MNSVLGLLLINLGLSKRAKHPKDRLYELHGSLMAIKCTNTSCDYIKKENLKLSICPALACNSEVSPFTTIPKPDSSAEVASKLSTMTLKDGTKPVHPQ
jgi:NAD-dependent SIR2 family protein deacetylase